MSRKFLILLLTALSLAASAMLAPATAQKPGDPKTNATTVNASKSNTFKTPAECTKARGKWLNGPEGLGCYLPAATRRIDSHTK